MGEKEEKTEEVAAKDEGSDKKDDMKVSVVGKIDLDNMNMKTRPDKKKAGKKEEKPAEKKEEPKAEEKKEDEKEEPKIEAREKISAERPKLSGPTVVGKIDLPEKSEKKSKGEKRKRKRIKKVDVNKQSKKGGGAR